MSSGGLVLAKKRTENVMCGGDGYGDTTSLLHFTHKLLQTGLIPADRIQTLSAELKTVDSISLLPNCLSNSKFLQMVEFFAVKTHCYIWYYLFLADVFTE